MPGFLTGVKDWASDPETVISLKKSAKVAALSGTCCLCAGILFGPAGIGVGAIALGISFYMVDMNNFGSAVYNLANFLNNSGPVDSSHQEASNAQQDIEVEEEA